MEFYCRRSKYSCNCLGGWREPGGRNLRDTAMDMGMPDSDEGLLNIKQAAKLLNVSQVSLRRWTDAGRLACLRVGPRRERRFRKADLLAYPEQQNGPVKQNGGGEVAGPGSRTQAEVHIGGISIDYGNHLCSFYENDAGRLKLAVPFLSDGLIADDICYFVAEPGVQKHVLDELRKISPGVDQAIDKRRLILSEGLGSATDMLDYFEREFLAASSAGKQRLRVLGDMAWFLEKGMDIAELTDFEVAYNHSLAHRFPVVSLCQYDARRFSGVGVLGALKSHQDTYKFPLSRFLGLNRKDVA